MEDNIWEYPFGDLDDDEELFYRKPDFSPSFLRLRQPDPGKAAFEFPQSLK
jgi:hypothetical protein